MRGHRKRRRSRASRLRARNIKPVGKAAHVKLVADVNPAVDVKLAVDVKPVEVQIQISADGRSVMHPVALPDQRN